jgi:OmcA/MtrC family decaheme c-type cytochrome
LAADGTPLPYGAAEVFGSDSNLQPNHYLKRVNYPNVLQNCQACHFEGTHDLPDQAKALAVSIESGGNYIVQNLDTLIGAGTAACASCHQYPFPDEFFKTAAVQTHAYLNSWKPQVFDNGKEDLLNFVEAESCVVCHGN